MLRIIKRVSVVHQLPVVIGNSQYAFQEEACEQEESIPDPFDEQEQEIKKRQELAEQQIQEKLLEAEKQAEIVISEAKKKAEQLCEQAQQEGLEQGKQQGYQEGLEQGRQAGLAEMQEQINTAAEKAGRMLEIAETETKMMVLDAERQIVDIIVAAMSKILAREIEENPMLVLPVVREALDRVRDQERVTIRVNPDDYDLVMQARRDLQSILGREEALSVLADQTISVGGCVIDTPYGTVDSRLDVRLEMVTKALQDVRP
ncbi:FliH/SctL family protein [Propionispora sp. 2/2-37]|uniref:FliH/SctL family protein n=1 Tax=Propionispora sp. 2/2-37 TaxID=1677858 RepID=UPI0006BB5CE9|nr:FliH/SctL family protein [Propionispora sp. 2/2-37]